MNATEPAFPPGTAPLGHAAQEAEFAGRCFCLLANGRFINRAHMPDHIRNPFLESDPGEPDQHSKF